MFAINPVTAEVLAMDAEFQTAEAGVAESRVKMTEMLLVVAAINAMAKNGKAVQGDHRAVARQAAVMVFAAVALAADVVDGLEGK